MQICDMSKCTGCRACELKCPKNAIILKENKMGVLIPEVDEAKCVQCGICKKVCQINEIGKLENPKKCYAVWTKQEEDRKLSSSGGISAGFIRSVLRENGVAFGALFNENFELFISDIHEEGEIYKIRGSKYVQCDTAVSYKMVQDYLIQGIKVIYTGTPCQIMGLKKYLGKDYDNLILVDIICHGVPPFKYLKEYVESIIKREKVTKVSFRGEKDFKLTIYNYDEVLYCKEKYKDLYFSAFLEGIIYRENCYSCALAQVERGSDITIGDFWGLDRTTMQKKYKGKISAVLINTDKGLSFFEKNKEMFEYEERTIEEAVKGNTQLRHPTVVTNLRKKFVEEYEKKGFNGSLNATELKVVMHEKQKTNSFLKKVMRKLKK